MIFFLKRLIYRLSADRIFLWVVLIPPLVYVGIMALTPSLHTLTSTLIVPDDAPIAQTGSPTGVSPLSPFVSSPTHWTSFVKDNFNAQRIMGYPRGYGLVLSAIETNTIYNEAIASLTIKKIDNKIKTIYTGSDEELGNRLVFYYSTTLYQRIQEGYKRQGSFLKSPLTDEPKMDPSPPAKRILWSHERAIPTFRWLFLGIMAFLIIQAIRELTDTSYKSEKQIAEHTQLPILGSLPNLNTVPVLMDASQHHT